MAESSHRLQQNQAFLQSMEKQRLNKLCHRIIDLRGKVTGECQAYQIGQQVHYLDDRGYLLIRQLIASCDGRYTVGVYEAFQKALKNIRSPETPPTEHPGPSLMRVDTRIQRQAQRVAFSTPIKISLADMLYHGHTIDISPQAIRVTLKRCYSLETNDRVNVEFVDFYQQSSISGLTSLAYTILKLHHSEHYTQLILTLASDNDEETVRWLDNWVQQKSAISQVDEDYELQNLTHSSYRSLWLQHLAAPVLWLRDDESASIGFMHVQPPAQTLLTTLFNHSQQPLSRLIPVEQLIAKAEPVLAAITKTACIIIPLQHEQLSALSSYVQQYPDCRVLLFQPSQIYSDPTDFAQQLSDLAEVDKTASEHVTQVLSELQQVVFIHDLTALFSYSSSEKTDVDLNAYQLPPTTLTLPLPRQLIQTGERHLDRFHIHTPVIVTINNQSLELETLDASAEGMAICIDPEQTDIKLGQRVSVNFSRWQTLSKKVDLSVIPYQVKNIQLWNDQLRLGLQRQKRQCSEQINQFFDDVITINRETLKPDNQFLIDRITSEIFSELLTPKMASTALFIGIDEQGQRTLETVAAAQNHDVDARFWQHLESKLNQITAPIKKASAVSELHITGIYAYRNSQGEWMSALEHEFTHAQHKAIFLQRLFSAPEHHIYHCNVMPLSVDSQTLSKPLMQWQQSHAHKVQQLRRQFARLFALVHLTEVSNVFRPLVTDLSH